MKTNQANRTKPTIRLQFKTNVGYSIIDGLKSASVLSHDPNSLEHLCQRFEDSLIRSGVDGHHFIRLRLDVEEIEHVKCVLEQQVLETQQQPLLDELFEAQTRIMVVSFFQKVPLSDSLLVETSAIETAEGVLGRVAVPV